MSEREGVIHALPGPVRYGLVILLLVALYVAFYLGHVLSIWVVIGPLLVLNFWTGQKFGNYGRADSPKLFWLGVAGAALMTLVGTVSLYELLAGLKS